MITAAIQHQRFGAFRSRLPSQFQVHSHRSPYTHSQGVEDNGASVTLLSFRRSAGLWSSATQIRCPSLTRTTGTHSSMSSSSSGSSGGSGESDGRNRVSFGGGLDDREGKDPSMVTPAAEPAATSNNLANLDPGMEVLRRCEERYKEAVSQVGRNLGAFFDEHVHKNPQADKFLGGFYSDYNVTVFTHSILGGAFGYILSRAVTVRLGPAPRLFAVTTFTAVSALMGAFSATRLATAELIKKSIPYTKTKETAWPLLLACRPLMQLKECVEDRSCRELLDTKVDNGKTMLEAYVTCRRRAEAWATQDEYMQIREEMAAREGEAGYSEAEEVASEDAFKEEFFGGGNGGEGGFGKEEMGGNGGGKGGKWWG